MRWLGIVVNILLMPTLCCSQSIYVEPRTERIDTAITSSVERYAAGESLDITVSFNGEEVHTTVGVPLPLNVPIGSVTKPLTAVLAVTLLSRKQLDGTIDEILPGFPHGKAVHVRDLILNRSGFTDLASITPLKVDDHSIVELAHLPLLFVPGTKMHYTSTDYFVLSMILTRVSGKPVSSLLQSLMRQSAMRHSGTIHLPISISVTDVNTEMNYSVPVTTEAFIGAGGVLSNSADLISFDQYVFERSNLVAHFRSDGFFDRDHLDSTGAGWFVAMRSSTEEYWHDGEFPGYSSVNIAIPAAQLYVTVCVRGMANTYLIGESIIDALLPV